ncbi:MAG: hypothetical protein E4H16_02480 [Candidatus Atribacteria bacterium]|nr:MAG: hypothetical protein E4H16_02480 [Candidatus Atribacteria bacterium]
MIFGLLSLSDSTVSSKDHVLNENHDELVLHPVAGNGFKGGCILHPRLPYETSDFCFTDKLTDILVLLSGSVYNKPELSLNAGLESSITCPELLGKLFLAEGPGFAEKLNGDFAFMVWRPEKREAFLYRDQVGIRPLAWTLAGDTLSFSSDMTGLCRAHSKTGSPGQEFLTGFFKYNDFRKLPESSVKKLTPGHFLRYSEAGLTLTRYWHPDKIKTDRQMSYDEMTGRLRHLLTDAVKIRCDRRFTAGAHVSSGIDSGVVSALARKEYGHQELFHGFSWSPAGYDAPGVKYDEREIIREGCLKANIAPVFSTMTMKDFPSLVSSFYFNRGFFAEDVTIADANHKGVNLLFSGWGGDEFISTGDRAIELDLLRNLKLGLFFKRNPIRELRKFVRNQLRFVVFPAVGVLDRATTKAFSKDVRYVRRQHKKSERGAIRNFYFHTSRRQMHLRMLRFYHLQERCETWAVNGYRRGVEYRYPLLDRRIIEFMLKVPSELLCQTHCYRPILREIGMDLFADEIRLQLDKDDHVYREFLHGIYREAAVVFIKDVHLWEANRDLDFIDFKLLREDIARYRSHSPGMDEKTLVRGLVNIRSVHEFTLKYKGIGDASSFS